MAAGEPPPYDPDEPGAVVSEPTERELRGLRRRVQDQLDGTVFKDAHTGRSYRYKPAPGKFLSTIAELTNCDHDHVICEVPLDKGPPMRICLICDAGRELLGLNGKPI